MHYNVHISLDGFPSCNPHPNSLTHTSNLHPISYKLSPTPNPIS